MSAKTQSQCFTSNDIIHIQKLIKIFLKWHNSFYILYFSIPLEVIIKTCYIVIISFACRDTESLFYNKHVNRFSAFSERARIKLKLVNAASNINDLRSPPGNRLELLSGDRKNQYSIRINNQWRICFTWHDSSACDVEIVDYH